MDISLFNKWKKHNLAVLFGRYRHFPSQSRYPLSHIIAGNITTNYWSPASPVRLLPTTPAADHLAFCVSWVYWMYWKQVAFFFFSFSASYLIFRTVMLWGRTHVISIPKIGKSRPVSLLLVVEWGLNSAFKIAHPELYGTYYTTSLLRESVILSLQWWKRRLIRRNKGS